jgi:hypothetical protein
MIVTLDGRKLVCNAPPERTLQSLVDDIRREHLGQRMVIEITVDGQSLIDPELSQRLNQPVGPIEQIDLTSGDARALVVAALRETAEQLDLAAGAHIEIANDLQAGHTADAIRQYGGLLEIWQACRSSVQNAGVLLASDFSDFRYSGRCLREWFEDLADRLREVRGAFEARDYVMLADALKYEMPRVCETWQALLSELRATIDPESAERSFGSGPPITPTFAQANAQSRR